MTAEAVDFRLLGALEMSANGASADLGPPKQRALLAILLLHAGEIVPVERLIDHLWGETPPRTAAHSIQIYVSDLRRALESLGAKKLLTTRPPGYQLDADPDTIDARRFERLVEEGMRHLREGDLQAGGDLLRSALRLWHGPALSDFAYEEFAQPYIRRFHDLHLDAIEQIAGAELEAGRLGDLVPMLETAIREDPLRERSRELLMLALYRSGRHPEALRTYQQLRAVLADELGLDPSPSLQRLQERILLHDPSLLPPPDQPRPEAAHRNPYKGLRSFTEADAGDFFGRDALVDRLLSRLSDGSRLLALVGPSGSGKSSAIGAGVIPRLRTGAIDGSERWTIAQMVPGANPLSEMKAAIFAAAGRPKGLSALLDDADASQPDATPVQFLSKGSRVLLVIDQFEELFTIADEVARRQFLDALTRAVSEPDSEITILLSLRADYYDRPLLHPEFAKVFTPGVENALPMSADELEAVVVGPAEQGGIHVEPQLLAALVADAADRPGALPLLEFALTELFDQRTGPILTLEGYRALGGIRGVLSRSAEAIYGGLRRDEQGVAMQVFLHLVQLGVGTAESRRRLALADLASLDLDPVALSAVLDAFGGRRLLSFDRDALSQQATVEVAHESLFREWDRLASWIDHHRTALKRYEVLAAATDEWLSADKHADYLLTGTRLAEFESWIEDASVQINDRQREFIVAGLERRTAEGVAERVRVDAQRRLERRARMRLVALAAVIVIAIGAIGAAGWAGLFDQPQHVALLHYGASEIDAMNEAGFDSAVSELGLVSDKLLFGGDVAGQVRSLIDGGAELVVIAGSLPTVGEVTAEYPDRRFVFGNPVEAGENVAYLQFADNQSSYLAGVAAALTSQTGKIGFIGGRDSPDIWAFHGGYEAGARSVNPDVEVLFEYLGGSSDLSGFTDASKADEAARRLYESGADVVFHAAGDAGIGVFEAADELSSDEQHLWAIGVDSDQYWTVSMLSGALDPGAWRDNILTSVLKHVDIAVNDVVTDFARGELPSGKLTYDLASRAIDISYSGGFIADLRRQIDAAREQIVDGTVIVPCFPTEREADFVDAGLAADYCWH